MNKTIATLSLFVCLSAHAEVDLVLDLPPEIWNRGSTSLLEEPRTERGVEIEAGIVFIENPTPERREFALLAIDSPNISSNRFAILGEVFYVDVEGEGYLETWSHFEQGGPYFTRTMSEFGPMRWLANTSMGFRDFSLPFQIGKGDALRPTRIDFNLVLPSTGRVYLRNVRLVEYTGNSGPLSTPGEWWGLGTSGKVGGFLGLFGGIMGALIGCCGSLVAKGKARGLCFGLLFFMAAAGLIQTMVGSIAYFGGQPYHVYNPLLIAGSLELVLGVVFFPILNSRYREAELRRVSALDA